MDVENALAGVAVTDLDRALAWYEQILGPGSRPMPEVAEWSLPGGGALQVYEGPERAGHGACTLIVHDIDHVAEELRRLGIADAEPVRHEAVDTVMIKDPDGNSVAFAAPKDPRLAR